MPSRAVLASAILSAATLVIGSGAAVQQRYVLPLSVVAVAVTVFALLGSRSHVEQRTYFVAPWGTDDASGSYAQPFGSLEYALQQLRPGDTLFVRGGEYRERIHATRVMAAHRHAPIVVAAWADERPIVVGLLWLHDIDYWTIRGIHVTWDPENYDSTQHMVKISGGDGWTYTNAEIWGARSYAAVLVTGGATDWVLSWLYVHDTQTVNGANQDHLVYISDAQDGLIAHCLLVGSPNGRGVKLGLPHPGGRVPRGIVVRHNTFVANGGGAVSSSYGAADNRIIGNIMLGTGDGANITAFQLADGSTTRIEGNVGWGTSTVVTASAGYDRHNNRQIDPMLDPSYRPTNAELLGPSNEPIVGHLTPTREHAPPLTLTWLP